MSGIRTLQALEKFGKRLREAREKLGYSQSYISSSLGYLADTYLSNIENGQKLVSYKKIKQLSELLEIPIGELIDLSMEVQRAKYYDTLSGELHEAIGYEI
jgi:transcriptional regulator with XRE-family HTH domain